MLHSTKLVYTTAPRSERTRIDRVRTGWPWAKSPQGGRNKKTGGAPCASQALGANDVGTVISTTKGRS